MNDFQFPYRVTVVRPGGDPDLRARFERQRYRVFTIEHGYERPNRFHREWDGYDKYSTYLSVLVDKVIPGGRRVPVTMAGCRLIDGERVPITLDRSLVRPGRHLEISRMLGNSKHTEDRTTIMCSLYAAVARYAFVTCGYDHLYCDTRLAYFRVLQGLLRDAIVQIGDPAVHEKNGHLLTLVPTMIVSSDLDKIISRLSQHVAPQLAAA